MNDSAVRLLTSARFCKRAIAPLLREMAANCAARDDFAERLEQICNSIDISAI
jgi:hypothetical protein